MQEGNEITVGTSEPRPGVAGLISSGAQIMEIRSRNQLMVAIQRPRDLETFAKELNAMAAQAGMDFFYSIPFKNHRPNCQDRRNCNCEATFIEGPGVGLARSALPLYGNCSMETGSVAAEETDTAWMMEATFIDFQRNVTRTERKPWSKMKTLQGGRQVVARDRDLDLAYAQGIARVERDCILKSLPRHIIEDATATAMQAARQSMKPVKEQIARLLAFFQKEFGMTGSMLAAYSQVSEFSEKGIIEAGKEPLEVLAHLRGVATAINSGLTTVEDAFGGSPAVREASRQVVPGDASVGGFTKVPQRPREERPPADPPAEVPGKGTFPDRAEMAKTPNTATRPKTKAERDGTPQKPFAPPVDPALGKPAESETLPWEQS